MRILKLLGFIPVNILIVSALSPACQADLVSHFADGERVGAPLETSATDAEGAQRRRLREPQGQSHLERPAHDYARKWAGGRQLEMHGTSFFVDPLGSLWSSTPGPIQSSGPLGGGAIDAPAMHSEKGLTFSGTDPGIFGDFGSGNTDGASAPPGQDYRAYPGWKIGDNFGGNVFGDMDWNHLKYFPGQPTTLQGFPTVPIPNSPNTVPEPAEWVFLSLVTIALSGIAVFRANR